MKTAHKSVFFKKLSFLALFAFLFFYGCAGPLQVKYSPKPASPPIKAPEGVAVRVEDFKDARPSRTKAIGTINANVADLTGDRLVLADEPAAIVTRAFEKELKDAGFKVVTSPEQGGDFTLKGELKEFRLDIAGKDTISMEIASELTENETGRVILSSLSAEKEERYAGVTGNTRESISKFISLTLAKAVRKTVSEASEQVAHTKAAYRPLEKKDVKTAEPDKKEPATETPPTSTGRLSITADQPRAKVYINDVYYGLAPLSIDLPPGVYQLIVKQKGYKDSRETVSVRKGEFTELEISLEK